MVFAKFNPDGVRRQQIAAGESPGPFDLVLNTVPLRAAVEAAAAATWEAEARVRAEEVQLLLERTTAVLRKMRDRQDNNEAKYAVACAL